jgi:hypothetical protein
MPGMACSRDEPARVHDEDAHAARALPERLKLSPAAESARAKLLVRRARDLDADFDVVGEHALGQVKGE